MSEVSEARKALDQVIRERVEEISSRPEGVESEMVIGWLLVIETMAPARLNEEQTQAWAIHVISSDTTGSRDLTPWVAKGYLHQVLDDPENYLMDYDHFSDE